MTIAVININDTGIQVGLDGEHIRTSPGYAVLHDSKLLTGEEARTNARLLPRWTNTRFWSQLSTKPLANGSHNIRHHADLVFAHLEDLWRPIKEEASKVVLAVPGYYSDENLGLLLGIAKECGVPVSGVVDQSLLAASDLKLTPAILHLEIHLHAITLTCMSNTGKLIRTDVKTVAETGLFTLWDRWANIIANQFIQSTRFDPMVEAATEQYLFTHLPNWIESRGPGGMHEFEMNIRSTTHTATISNDSLLKAVSPLYPALIQMIRTEIPANTRATLLISHRFKGFPGLIDSLSLIDNLDLHQLEANKYLAAVTKHASQIISTGGKISHVLALNSGERSTNASISDVSSQRSSVQPTHLLWHHQAVEIGKSLRLSASLAAGPVASDSPICIFYYRGAELFVEPVAGQPTVKLNGEPLGVETPLKTGDKVLVGSDELTLISVTKSG